MRMPYGLLSCDVSLYVVWFIVTAIVFVVHAYPLRFVFLVVVGMGSVIVLRFAVGYPQTHNLCKS